MARTRLARLGIVGLLATALFGGALGLVAPASAGGGTTAAGSAAAGDAVARALPVRNLNDKLVQKPRGLFLKGNVNPGYGKKVVVLVRAKCEDCKFKKFGKTKTNKAGKFTFRLSAPRKGSWYWKAYAKKSGGYGKSWSNYVYRTYRI